MDSEGIKKLANLSRVELSDEETDSFAREIEQILNYVESVKKVAKEAEDLKIESSPVENVFRSDIVSEQNRSEAESVLAQAPATQDHFVKVKKIL